MTQWHSTDNLILDRDGFLWRKVARRNDERPIRWLRLGPIEAGPDVPAALKGELAECLDLWHERIDDRAEQLWSYEHRG